MPEVPPTEPLHTDVRYEQSDVNVRGVIGFGIGLAILAAIIHLAIAWLLPLLARQERAQQPAPLPIALKRPRLPADLNRITPPRLEESEFQALQELRAEEERLLHSQGWIDRKANIARIPIEQAMQMLTDADIAERYGVKVRPQQEKRK